MKQEVVNDIVKLFDIRNQLEEEHLAKELMKLTKHGANTLHHYLSELVEYYEEEISLI